MTDETTSQGNGSSAGGLVDETPQMPLFFKDPRPLDRNRHGKKCLPKRPNFSFAKNTNAIPITGSEFGLVARDYPIIFTGGDRKFPIAGVGLRQDTNEFVDADGNWAEWCYIPAYVRRYPFVFMENPGSDKLILCLDEDADFMVEDGDNPLFVDNEPSDITKAALDLCKGLHQDQTLTAEFMEAVGKADLLVEKTIEATNSAGEKVPVATFLVINETKFNELGDEEFIHWRKKGWLPLVYFHLTSMFNWPVLVDRTARAAAKAGNGEGTAKAGNGEGAAES